MAMLVLISKSSLMTESCGVDSVARVEDRCCRVTLKKARLWVTQRKLTFQVVWPKSSWCSEADHQYQTTDLGA